MAPCDSSSRTRTDCENLRNHRMPRQFYINTGHVRQRQSLFNPNDVQVEPLYGINEAVFDPQEPAHDCIQIQVPPIFNIDPNKDCHNIELCVPRGYPGCPPTSKGTPCCKQYPFEKASGKRCCRGKPSCSKTKTCSKQIQWDDGESEWTDNNNVRANSSKSSSSEITYVPLQFFKPTETKNDY